MSSECVCFKTGISKPEVPVLWSCKCFVYNKNCWRDFTDMSAVSYQLMASTHHLGWRDGVYKGEFNPKFICCCCVHRCIMIRAFFELSYSILTLMFALISRIAAAGMSFLCPGKFELGLRSSWLVAMLRMLTSSIRWKEQSRCWMEQSRC